MDAKKVKAIRRRVRALAAEGNPIGEKWAGRFAEAEANGEPLELLCHEFFADVNRAAKSFVTAFRGVVEKKTGMSLEDYLELKEIEKRVDKEAL